MKAVKFEEAKRIVADAAGRLIAVSNEDLCPHRLRRVLTYDQLENYPSSSFAETYAIFRALNSYTIEDVLKPGVLYSLEEATAILKTTELEGKVECYKAQDYQAIDPASSKAICVPGYRFKKTKPKEDPIKWIEDNRLRFGSSAITLGPARVVLRFQTRWGIQHWVDEFRSIYGEDFPVVLDVGRKDLDLSIYVAFVGENVKRKWVITHSAGTTQAPDVIQVDVLQSVDPIGNTYFSGFVEGIPVGFQKVFDTKEEAEAHLETLRKTFQHI